MTSTRTWTGFVKLYLKELSLLLQVNLAGESEGFGPRVSSRRRLPAWSRLAELFYAYFSLKLALIIVFQRHYSRLRFELERETVIMRANNNNNNYNNQSSSGNKWWAREEKAAQVEAAAWRLELLGAAFYELGPNIEPTLIVLLVVFWLNWVHSRVYVAHKPVKLAVLAMLLDPERERELSTERETARQVARFTGSRTNYALGCSERAYLATIGYYETLTEGIGLQQQERVVQEQVTEAGVRPWSRAVHQELGDVEGACAQMVGVARELELAGQLVPSNRRPEWRLQVARVYGALALFLQVLGLGLILVVLLGVPRANLANYHVHTAPRDLLFLAELVAYNLLCHQVVCFYLVTVVSVAHDQSRFVLELSELLASTTENLRLFRDNHLQPAGASGATVGGTSPRNHLNWQLVRALLMYKQLVAQMETSRHFVGFLGAHMALVMLCGPVIDRLYVAQMTRQVRLLSFVRDLLIALTCDVVLLPNCWLYARCLALLKSMFCLLAHIDAHQAQASESAPDQAANSCQRAQLDEHTVWLLRRELQSPEFAMRRFATSAYFMRLTYADLIGIHFWCGFLLAPLLLRDTVHLGAVSGSTPGSFLGGTLATI